MPGIPSWLLEPLRDQFAALLPDRPVYDPAHPLGCHRQRIADRIIFEKLVQVLRFGCSYASIADCACSATTIRERRDEWIRAGIFAELKKIARDSYDRMIGLLRDPGRRPVHHQGAGRRGMRWPRPGRPQKARHETVEPGRGVRYPARPGAGPGNRHDSPLLVPTLDKLDDLGPLPDDIRIHLHAGYDSAKTREELVGRGMTRDIARKGDKARIFAALTDTEGVVAWSRRGLSTPVAGRAVPALSTASQPYRLHSPRQVGRTSPARWPPTSTSQARDSAWSGALTSSYRPSRMIFGVIPGPPAACLQSWQPRGLSRLVSRCPL